MRKILLTLFSIAMVLSLGAQDTSFFDDFEGFNEGDPIAATSDIWGSWASPGGGPDEAFVSAEQAFSGSLSLKLEAQAPTGGPTDIVLPFGERYESGDFYYEQMMYVASGTGAYFNFQGETTIGQVWVSSNHFNSNGTAEWRNSDNTIVSTSSFPHDTWFKVRFEISLTNNLWRVFLDDELVSEYSNPVNAIASLNLYALNPEMNGPSLLYIDDVSFTFEDFQPLQLDAAASTLFTKQHVFTGRELPVSFILKNVGQDWITSFDATLTNGEFSVTESFDGQFIGSLEEGTFDFPGTFTTNEGLNEVMITVSNINGEQDMDMSNNTNTVEVNGYTPSEDRGVVIEEGTGTWCTWCPRGHVFMEYMEEEYHGNFVGIAAHNGDPMAIPGYTTALGYAGYPQMIINRDQLFGFGRTDDIELLFCPDAATPTVAKLDVTANYDAASGIVNFELSAEMKEDMEGATFAMVVVEDNVTGTGAGYDQINAYAGGTNGPMGGYELLSNPVPASQMVYQDVARLILGGVDGEPGSLPMNVVAGETHTYEFAATLDPSWNIQHIKLAVMIMNADGSIANAAEVDFNDASGVVSTKDVFRNDLAVVSPNPFSTATNLELNLENDTDVHLAVYNMAGLLVAEKDYGQLSGNQLLPFDGSSLGSGMYFMHIRLDDALITKKVTITK